MPWYVQKSTGALRQAAKSPGAGWVLVTGSAGHTRAQAENDLVQMVLHDNQGINVAPGAQRVAKNAGNAANSAAKAVVPGLSQTEQALSALQDKNTWVRVAKVIIGGGLLLIGIAHMTGASDVISTTARRAPLPV